MGGPLSRRSFRSRRRTFRCPERRKKPGMRPSMHDLGSGPPAQEEAGPDGPLPSKQRVYIIDDDPSVRNALIRFLAMKGMTPVGFGAAEAFLAELPRLAPGALIVDMQLPGVNG